MPACSFCDHHNAPDCTRCEKCGAELPVDPQAAQRRAARQQLTGLDAAVADAYEREGIIAAIKLYREATGQGLKESKEAVESIARGAGLPSPRGAGCGTVAAALVATLCLAASGWIAALPR